MADIEIKPVGPDRWDDLEQLFGPSGAYSGCWCMFPRCTNAEFEANAGAGNRARFAAIVASGTEPGLLAYLDGAPVGWVGVAPRDEYGRILRSPLHGPADDAVDVWSITCFFIAKSARGHGVASELLGAAIAFATERGARHVEAYPSRDGATPAEMWQGKRSMFERAGFDPIVERKPGRPVMRLTVT